MTRVTRLPARRYPHAVDALDPSLLPANTHAVLDALRRAGGRPYVVGGTVRDLLLGAPVSKDVDLEVFDLAPEAIAAALAGFGSVNAVGASFGVIKVHFDGGEDIDVALPRRESKTGAGHRGFLVAPDPTMTAEEAAARRDFTVNAMMWDPASGTLLDPFGGRGDLGQRVLRHTSAHYVEDALRVLRGMQFCARFDLEPAAETIALSATMAGDFTAISRERVWTEWWKWATRSVSPSRGLWFLRHCGFIERFYPELHALIDCPQEPDWHPEGPVWEHTLHVVDAAASIAARDGLAPDERGLLLLGALAHDLGKPGTTAIENGRIRSIGHTEHVEPVRGFFARIDAPARLVDACVALTQNHLVHLGGPTPRSVRRLAHRLGEAGTTIDMLARVIESDGAGRPPLPPEPGPPLIALRAIAADLALRSARPRPIVLGRHLIEWFGMTPGPSFRALLDAAFEAQLDGAFADLDSGRAWLTRHLGEREA